MRSLERQGKHLREPEVADLPRANELRHRPDGLLDRRRRIGSVQVVEVDAVGCEPGQGLLARPAHVLRAAVQAASTGTPRLVVGMSELRRDDRFVAASGERSSDELLVHAVLAVHVRRVEHRDAQLERTMDGGDRLPGFSGRPVERGHPHTPESQRRHFETGRSELASLHALLSANAPGGQGSRPRPARAFAHRQARLTPRARLRPVAAGRATFRQRTQSPVSRSAAMRSSSLEFPLGPRCGTITWTGVGE